MPIAVSQRPSLRLLSRSFMAFVLAPENPIANWLAELDLALRRSARFFADRPVIMDLSRANLSRHDLTQLIADLNSRGIRILGIEGADPILMDRDFPPRLRCSRVEGDRKMIGAGLDGGSSPEHRKAKFALARRVGTLRSIRRMSYWRCDRSWVGRVGSRRDRRRLDSHLRHAARPRTCWRERQYRRTHLLQQK